MVFKKLPRPTYLQPIRNIHFCNKKIQDQEMLSPNIVDRRQYKASQTVLCWRNIRREKAAIEANHNTESYEIDIRIAVGSSKSFLDFVVRKKRGFCQSCFWDFVGYGNVIFSAEGRFFFPCIFVRCWFGFIFYCVLAAFAVFVFAMVDHKQLKFLCLSLFF